jgi:hypothetical protein
MAGYSRTPLWKKLGVGEGASVSLLGAPRGWSIPELPAGARTRRRRADGVEAHDKRDVVLAFTRSRAVLQAQLPALARAIHPDGALWIAWPRRAAGHVSDMLEQHIRDAALPLGLVDVKVAAIDEDWSGLRLVWRRERRS